MDIQTQSITYKDMTGQQDYTLELKIIIVLHQWLIKKTGKEGTINDRRNKMHNFILNYLIVGNYLNNATDI